MRSPPCRHGCCSRSARCCRLRSRCGLFALFERIFQYLDLEHEIVDKPGAKTLERVRGQVALRNVWFHYEEPELYQRDGDGAEPRRTWTLEDVTLEVQPGQLAAIVGPSGAGKTTISYLIPRLYDVARGRVELDGHDVRDLTLATLARAIGMVTQETYLFHASVRENLLYAKPEATEDEFVAAARVSAIHDRILEPRTATTRSSVSAATACQAGEAAARDRPSRAEEPAGADPRRGDLRARHR